MSQKTEQSEGSRARPVRLGVIGAGAIGARHARIAANLPGCRLSGISDPNPAAGILAEEVGARYYGRFEEMLGEEGLDGVIIAAPTDQHASIGIRCAECGVHLLVEKPIAASLEDARKLTESARSRRVTLLVGHHRRFNPLVETAREIVRSGRLGRLVAVSALWTLLKPADYFDIPWHRQPGAGPVLTNLIHDVDCLRYICGEIQRVYAEVSSAIRGLAVEDTAVVTLRFRDGALGTVATADCVASMWSYETTTGENPMYPREEGNCYFFFGTEASLAFPTMHLVRYRSPDASGWKFPLTTEAIRIPAQDPLLLQLEHFCAAIRGQTAPRTGGEDAAASLAVALAVLESGARGLPVEFPPRRRFSEH